jgi:hypothetical protein
MKLKSLSPPILQIKSILHLNKISKVISFVSSFNKKKKNYKITGKDVHFLKRDLLLSY